MADWLTQAQATRRLILDNYEGLDDAALLDVMIRENILVQLQNLQTHPSVLSRLAGGTLQLYGWIYDIGQGSVESSMRPSSASFAWVAPVLPRQRPSRYSDAA